MANPAPELVSRVPKTLVGKTRPQPCRAGYLFANTIKGGLILAWR
jgi:hypothetical protein